jgi:septal ring factor EnvC (AmiA/AmiB activator)
LHFLPHLHFFLPFGFLGECAATSASACAAGAAGASAHLQLSENHGFKKLLAALHTALAEKDAALRELKAAIQDRAIEHDQRQKIADAKALKKKHSSEQKAMQKKHNLALEELAQTKAQLSKELAQTKAQLSKALDDQKMLQSNLSMLQEMFLRQPAGADAEAPAAPAAQAEADVAAHSPKKPKGRKKCRWGKKCKNLPLGNCKFLHEHDEV